MPDWRLGQLLSNASRYLEHNASGLPKDLFNVEDDDIREGLIIMRQMIEDSNKRT